MMLKVIQQESLKKPRTPTQAIKAGGGSYCGCHYDSALDHVEINPGLLRILSVPRSRQLSLIRWICVRGAPSFIRLHPKSLWTLPWAKSSPSPSPHERPCAGRRRMKRLPQALVVAMPLLFATLMKTKVRARASAPLRLDVATG
jgi:hypothetical protein